MKKISRFAAIAAAATLALSLGACSKDEETKEREDAPEVTQSAEEADVDEDAEAAEETEDAEETAEVTSEYPEFTEGEGVGPAYLNTGYMAFEVGEDMEWVITGTTANDDPYGSAYFMPKGTYRATTVAMGPRQAYSMEETAKECLQKAESKGNPVEDLGEVEINGVTYYKFASIDEYTPPALILCTLQDKSKYIVDIQADADEMGSYDFALPEAMDLLFDTLTFPDWQDK